MPNTLADGLTKIPRSWSGAVAGTLKAQGFTSQGALDTYQSAAARSNARSAETAGYLGAVAIGAKAATSLLTKPAKPSITDTYAGGSLRPGGGIGLKLG